MPTPVPEPSALLGRVEAARYLGLSTAWLDRAASAGKVPSYKFSGKVLYDPADLRALVASGYRPASEG